MSKKYIVLGYAVSVGLFMTSMVVMINTAQGNVGWLVIMAAAFLTSIITSAVFPRAMRNGKSFYAGAVVMAGMLLMAIDMYDEMIGEYGGGFAGGNGFLLDGLSIVAYAYIIPLLFPLSCLFLITNSKRKLARLSKSDAKK